MFLVVIGLRSQEIMSKVSLKTRNYVCYAILWELDPNAWEWNVGDATDTIVLPKRIETGESLTVAIFILE